MSVKQFVKPAEEIETPKSIDVEELLTWSDEEITQLNSKYLPCWGCYKSQDVNEGHFMLRKIEKGREIWFREDSAPAIKISGFRYTADNRFGTSSYISRSVRVGKILLVPDPRVYSLILEDLKKWMDEMGY